MAANLFSYAQAAPYSSNNQDSIKATIDGKQSVVITMKTTYSTIPVISDKLSNLVVGETYKVSLWIKSSVARPWTSNIFYVNGQSLARLPSSTVANQVTTDWQYIETYLTYRSGSVSNIHLYPSMQAGDVLTVGDVRVEAYERVNEFFNPRLSGSGTVAQYVTAYVSPNSSLGTRSVSAGVQAIKMTSTTGSPYRVGVYLTGLAALIPDYDAGSQVTVSVEVTELNLPSGVRARLWIETPTGTAWPNASVYINDTGRFSVTITGGTPIVSFQAYVWLESTAPWSGEASVSFKDPLVEKGARVRPYFDGSTYPNRHYTRSWVGSPNASASVSTPGRTVNYPSDDGWIEKQVKRLREGLWVAIRKVKKDDI